MMFRCFFVSLFLPVFSQAQSILTLEGKYGERNLYFQNPLAPGGMGFCTDSVYVNGVKANDVINSSAFEIRLSDKGFKPYDSLVVKIYHKPGCAPRLLSVDPPYRSYIRVKNISINEKGLLEWTTVNDSTIRKMTLTVEQYVWNKWIQVGEVEMNDINQTRYSFQTKLHSGVNRFRVKYTDLFGKPMLSESVTVDSGLPEVKFELALQAGQLLFSQKTRYEIYDATGNFVKRGYTDVVDITNLEKGDYYLNYDCKMEELRIK